MKRRTYFSQAASTWDEMYHTPQLAAFLERLVPEFGLKPGQNILDLGTGTGVLIPYLFEAVSSSGSITAMDYADKMVEICRSKYSHLKNVTVILQDVENLDLPSESFDAVTCFGLFPHLEDKEKTLRHMNRVLKPRGKLIVSHAFSSIELKTHHRTASSAVDQDFLPKESDMRQLLEDAGFTEIKIKDVPGCYLCLSNKHNQ
jgi:ubiquinone/menaquinone biosynthesis C-methylase UbiE